MSLIVLEGLDGTGKSTQLPLLEQALARRGPVRAVSFPDYASPSSALVKMYLGGAFGSAPGDVNAYAAGAFYAVDRYASFRTGWGEDYRRGVTILAGRYATSNLLYQMEKLPESQWEAYIAWVEDFEYHKLGLPRPDRVILLDMPVEVSQKLLSGRYGGQEGQKDIHERDRAFLENCARCARFAAARLGWRTVHCARGGRPLQVEEIHQQVLQAAL
ncbi:dTMP kinase [Acutalibacter caecimuris]|uniref:dTMP kinase n=1 Tax=Acutalibacter caecimuris TaxID=3093657 RepID=UPI002AC8CB65|nr:thymidylate kinase [Acutalibacter sp. M00118]